MSRPGEEFYRHRIAELEADLTRLKTTRDSVKADCKALRDEPYGPVREDDLTTEDEMAAIVKDHVPGAGAKFFAELGLLSNKPARSLTQRRHSNRLLLSGVPSFLEPRSRGFPRQRFRPAVHGG
jgi:hypothetical protein